MIDKGKITNVVTRAVGTSLNGDHAAAETTLLVDDPFPFDERGGTLSINGTEYTYTATDDEASTITLADGLDAGADDGDTVVVLPAAYDNYATVQVDGGDRAIDCLIPFALAPWIPLGTRDPQSAETVTIAPGIDGHEVVNVLGKLAQITESVHIEPALAPPPETIYIDGSPDYYIGDPDSTWIPYTPSEMTAHESEAGWITTFTPSAPGAFTMNSQLFDDAHSPSGDTLNPQFWPGWLIPTDGRDAKVVLDSVEFSGDFNGSYTFNDFKVSFYAVESDGTLIGSVDQFDASVVGDGGTGVTVNEATWDAGRPSGTIQDPPIESVAVSYQGYDPQPQYVVVVVWGLWDGDSGGAWTEDQVAEITGLRVVLV